MRQRIQILRALLIGLTSSCLLMGSSSLLHVSVHAVTDYGYCPTLSSDWGWSPKKVHYTLTAAAQNLASGKAAKGIHSAAGAWNMANKTNCSRVNFFSSLVDTSPIILTFDVQPYVPGSSTASGGFHADSYDGLQVASGRIVIGLNAQMNGVPAWSTTAANFESGVHARMLHEIGHSMGLDHPPVSTPPPYPQVSYAQHGKSVMNTWTDPNTTLSTNAASGWQPSKIKSCDNDMVRVQPFYTLNCYSGSYPVPPTLGGCVPASIPNTSCPPGTTAFTEEGTSSLLCCYASPIIIDLDGDAFDLTDEAAGVNFDIGGDGTADSVSWTDASADDVWLALDRNGDGAIQSGGELFGNFTEQPATSSPNGFNALAEFDGVKLGGNGDGKITTADAVFDYLRLWRDTNHNGLSESAELMTLQSVNLVSISLTYAEWRHSDPNGNYFKYIGSAIVNNSGTPVTRIAADVYLITNGGPPSGGYGKVLGDGPEVAQNVVTLAVPQLVADRSLGVTSSTSRTRLRLRR